MAAYRENFESCGHEVLPLYCQCVGQVHDEVQEAGHTRRQIGLIEERTVQEALHDGRDREGREEEDYHTRVGVLQNFARLQINHNIYYV